MRKPRVGVWFAIQVCNVCEHKMSNDDIYQSYGCCPYCGHSVEGTVCDIKPIVMRRLDYNPWWMFWNRVRIYEGNNRFHQEWLDKYYKQ